MSVSEEMVPGAYTALVDLKIRSQMDTKSMTNQVGVYSRGVPFTVYEVYPEKDGIVWGRVSSNVGDGTSRFVGLRVANQLKAHLEKAMEEVDLAKAVRSLADAVTLQTVALRDLARR